MKGNAYGQSAAGWIVGVGGVLVVGLALVFSVPEARAANECGSGSDVTCTSSGNTYSGGITYNSPNQTVRLDTGVVVNTGTSHGVWLESSGAQTLNIASGVTIDTSGSWDGVLVGSAAFSGVSSAVTINASGSSIKTTGSVAYGYELYGTGSIEAHVGSITATGNGSIGLYAETVGGITVTTGGVVSLSGNNSSPYSVYGVYAKSTGTGANAGNVSVDTTGGAVSLTGTTAQTAGVTATSAGGKVTIKTGGVSVAGAGAVGVSGSGSGTDATGAVMVDIDTTGGTVSLTGATSGPGVYASSFGAINVKTGNVQVAGNWGGDANLTSGIFASSFGTGAAGKVVVDTTAGAVSLTGTTSNFWGIFAGSSGGAVEVTTANVSTKAGSSTGILAQSGGTGATGAVTVNTTAGLVKTEGAGAVGISAQNTAAASGGLVTVSAGDVTTTGTGAANGISASSTSGGVKVTAGTVTTAGNGAVGVNASAGGAIDVAATKIVTTGDNAYGFQASGTASANVKVTVGEVQTGGASTGAGAHGVNATGAGLVDIESIAGSKITTKGKGARGVNVDKLGGGVAVNVRSIETSGDNATGIHVYNGTLGGSGAGGAITVTANSIVTTGATVKGSSNHYEVGNGADGIDVFNIGSGDAGKITIDTSVGLTNGTLGTVNVSGRKSRGIVAVSGRLVDAGGDLPDIPTGGGPIMITAGNVTTTGDFGTAISATNWGQGADGAITINALGTISASGANIFYSPGDVENEGNYQPDGIIANSWAGGDIKITTHDVSSVGEAASAISAQSGNGDQYAGIGKVTINTTAGTVSAKGAGSDGIGVGGSSGEVSITSGIINTEGDFGYGILAGNTGPNSAMTIDTRGGKITTKGQGAAGIGANSGNWILQQANAGLVKILAGAVDVQGKGAVGITANTYNGNMDVQLFGALTTGTEGGDGVSLRAAGATKASVTVTSTGSVHTTAASADGLNLAGGSTDTYTVTIGGQVKAEGASTYGIVVNGTNDSVTIDQGGSVTGEKGIQFQETGGNAKVTNSGTLTGTGGTALNFLGTTTATFDNDGTVTGNVLMYNGDDTVILRSNSAVAGNIEGKGGTDKLTLTGAGTASSLNTATIIDFENAEKTGTGKWALTGTNADFAPTFAVSAGLLAANATLTGTAFTVANGATLGGNGVLKSVTVAAGGKLAPGNSIDTLSLGSVTYDPGAIYEVEIDPDTSDLVNASGTASISSTAEVHVLVSPTGTYTDGKRYKILDASIRTGEFAPTVVDNSAFLSFTLDQSIAGQVWLVAALTAELPDVAETPNQIAAAGGIDEQGPGTPLFDAIVPLDAETARHAFDLTSGEIHATEKGVLVEDSRFIREAILQRLDEAFAPGGAGADPMGPAIATWAQAFGSGGTGEGDGNAASYTRSIGGFAAGIDLGEAGAWRFGVATGYQSAALSVPDRASTAQTDGYHFAMYGGVENGPLAFRFGGALTSGTVDTVRHATFGGFDETLTASYGAHTGQLFAEASYRRMFGNVAVVPFAGVAHVAVDTDGFTESGGVAALSAGPAHQAMTLASFGARFEAPLPMAGARITALLAWQHRFGEMTPAATVAFDGGTPFTVAGAPRKRDSLRVEAGFEWDISPRATLSVGYSGNISSGAADHGAKATLRFRF